MVGVRAFATGVAVIGLLATLMVELSLISDCEDVAAVSTSADGVEAGLAGALRETRWAARIRRLRIDPPSLAGR